MDSLVTQLVQFVQSVPPESFFLVYLFAGVWLMTESLGIGVPIEPVLLLLGALISQRQLNPILGLGLTIGAATIGTILGAFGGYSIGRTAGHRIVRVGRFVGLTPTRVEHMALWLRQRGARGVFAARFVPVLRGLAPYVIGASNERVATFLLGTITGAATYTGLWIVVGFVLGNHYQDALRFFDQFGLLGLAAAIAVLALGWALHYLWVRFVWGRLASHFHRHRAATVETAAAP